MSRREGSGEPAGDRPARLGATEVARALLQRGATEHDSVTIARNARGVTQFEVTVRTSDSGEVRTIAEAEVVAVAVYDRLRERYPIADDTNGAA